MTHLLHYPIIASVLICLSSYAFAKDDIKNTLLNCTAKHLYTDQLVEVKISSGITRKKIATAQWPLGYPTIVINDRDFLKLPINTRQFIYYHECAHLKFGIIDQFNADCKSLELINEKHGLSEIDIRKLVKTLLKQFGMSHRWSKLLQCEIIWNNR